jgi:hypothetical protein
LALLVATGAMAMLDTVEFARGATTAGIFTAVLIDAICAVSYSVLLWQGRCATRDRELRDVH